MITTSQNTRDIKFIRAVWGDMDLSLIPQIPQYNEVVYVWGIENKLQLDSMGYTTILCDRNKFNFKYTSLLYEFIHKLIAIEKASKSFSKILFLDWDYNLYKNLDNDFFDYINTKTFLAPIYEYDIDDSIYSYNDLESFEYNKSELMKKYSWLKDGKYIIPNAGFIYISDSNIGNELLQIAKNQNLKTLIEEFAIQIWSNSNLENYIENFHPKVCFGRNESDINTYVESIIEKDIYFKTI